MEVSGFTNISKFCPETNQHILTLGITISRNHPVLSNHTFLGEMKEKIKGLDIDINEVST